MAQQITRADSVLISDTLKTTSLIVAEKFGKRHDNVIRAIEALDIPDEYHARNFEDMVHEAQIGSGATRQSKHYSLTRDGFALLVMGFTGKRAMAWKIKFLEAFTMMEAELRSGSKIPAGYVEQAGYLMGLRTSFLHKSPEELAQWARGEDTKIDKIVTYLETTLIDPNLDIEAARELSRLRSIAKHLRGDAVEVKTIPVRAHVRKVNPETKGMTT